MCIRDRPSSIPGNIALPACSPLSEPFCGAVGIWANCSIAMGQPNRPAACVPLRNKPICGGLHETESAYPVSCGTATCPKMEELLAMVRKTINDSHPIGPCFLENRATICQNPVLMGLQWIAFISPISGEVFSACHEGLSPVTIIRNGEEGISTDWGNGGNPGVGKKRMFRAFYVWRVHQPQKSQNVFPGIEEYG